MQNTEALQSPEGDTSASFPLAYSVNTFVKASNGSCGRTKVYELIRAGRLKAKRLDGRTLIPARDAAAFIESLPDFDAAKAA